MIFEQVPSLKLVTRPLLYSERAPQPRVCEITDVNSKTTKNLDRDLRR